VEQPEKVAWGTVCRGDQLRSAANGKLYPVLGTRSLGMSRYKITVKLPNGPKVIERPTAAEPDAYVVRGTEGKTVQVFVEVFSS
jgi:hypothetical protein